MSWSEIVRLLGTVTIITAIVTFSLGFFRFNIKDRVKIHKYFAFAFLVLALVHGGIVVYRTYFMNGLERLFHP